MGLRYRTSQLKRKFEAGYATHNRIEVSRSALLHNLDLFAGLSGKQVIPVLKSNAYGHGLELVAQALKGRQLPYVAVDGYFEAMRIRQVTRQPVLVMGMIKPENFRKLKYHDFTFVVHDRATITALAETRRRVKVHLEVNTGMNRYGCEPTEVAGLAKLILSHPKLQLEGVMGHLADADGTSAQTVRQAVDIFDQAVDAVRGQGGNPAILHVAQSAGSVRAESKYSNTMRLGIGLYGINPFAASDASAARLKDLCPALRLVSTITKTHQLHKGDKVSYNYTFTAPKTMNIGVLPLGYYEGIDRALSNKGVVKIGTAFLPITGRVCMNHTMISLDGRAAGTGDEVIVISNRAADENSVQRIADIHGLFTYKLLTGLSSDVRRVLVD